MKSRKIFIMENYKKELYTAVITTLVFVLFVGLTGISKLPTQKNYNSQNTLHNSNGSGTTIPLAKFKTNANVWFKRMNITKKQWLSKLPSKKELGVPVYPGVVLVVYQSGYKGSKETLLPEVILASPDSISKIEAWYAEKLKNWNHNKTYHAFLPSGKKVDVMSDKYKATRHVELEQAISKNQFDGMFLKQPANTKTGIIIRY